MTSPERTAIESELLHWMQEPMSVDDDARFAALAVDLFAFQFSHCTPYRRFCEGRGVTPASCRDWRDIPAVPTGAFTEMVLTSFPEADTHKIFRTSGTSAPVGGARGATGGVAGRREGIATATRGALHLDTLELYHASLLAAFRRALLPDLAEGESARALVLAPSPEEAPDSSLSHMFGVVLETLCDPASGFHVREGALDTAGLLEALEAVDPIGPPLLLCGTAFSFVHLLDAMTAQGARLKLPARTRIKETGGFKGRARERSRDELYLQFEAALGVPAARIVNQYGMTELGSQFYDSVLACDGPRRKLRPPWTRVLFEDPRTAREVTPGQTGMIRVLDLANTGSVCAIQTADLGMAVADGFEVLGREPGAEARGCSIAADEMLGAS